MTQAREELIRKHIIGVLSAYTGKSLTSDVLPKLTDDIVQSVNEVELLFHPMNQDITQ